MTGRGWWVWASMVAAPLSVWLSGCGCQTQYYDQIYLLDANAGVPLSSADAALSTPASDADADVAADAAGASDTTSASIDCTSAAAGCAPGGDCLAACECIRDRLRFGAPSNNSIKECTLLAGDGPPAVDMRYVVTFPGCGD